MADSLVNHVLRKIGEVYSLYYRLERIHRGWSRDLRRPGHPEYRRYPIRVLVLLNLEASK